MRFAAALVVFGLVALGLSDALSSSGSGFVRRVGTQLYLDGRPYRFVGLNFFQANMTRPIPNCSRLTPNRNLGRQFNLMGPGHQMVRVWFFQRMATVRGKRNWSAFDRTLAAARQHGYKVVATLGDQWNYCEGPYKERTWYVSGYKNAVLPGDVIPYRRWVASVVRRYRNNPTIAIWELMNEPEIQTSETATTCPADALPVMKRWATDVSKLAKSIDRHHLVSLGTGANGNCGLQGADFASVYSVPSLDICTYHDFWGPSVQLENDPYNGIQLRIDQCKALDKPIYAGESGIDIDDVASPEERANLLAAKLRAQFVAGISGFLAWNWGTSSSDDYEIGPRDPALAVLRVP